MTDSEREQIYARHPVKNRDIEFATTSGEYVFQELRDALTKGLAGVTFIGAPRSGLSVALRLAAAGIESALPEVPLCHVFAGARRPIKETSLWTAILAKTGPTGPASRDSQVLRERLRINLEKRARHNRCDRVLLLIDRAHELEASQCLQLALLQDELWLERIRLVVCLGGYEALRGLRDDMAQSGDMDPVLRWLANERSFSGLRSAADLQYFMSSFDDEVYPKEGGYTYTEFFFPSRYREGWRLAHDAPKAWSAFVAEDSKFSKETTIEMAYAAQAVCNVMDAAYLRGTDWTTDEGAWGDAVRSSGLIEARTLASQLARKTDATP